MKLPPTRADRMNEFSLWLSRATILGEPACELLGKAGFTIIDVYVLRRLLLMAGFTGEEIERAQTMGTTSALTVKIMQSLPGETCSAWEAFLEDSIPNAEARAFLQRSVGQAVMGDQFLGPCRP